MKQLAIILGVLLFSFQGNSQTKQAPEIPSPIIFIYDASGSMWGKIQGKTKMDIASSVLSNSINDFAENQKIGLVAYGHRKKGDCRDVETLLPITNTSKSKVAAAVKGIKPLGMTPLAYSASTVFDLLRKSKEKATIVLITDGIESCDGNICDLVKAAKAEGIDFKLHIVGFGLKKGETQQLECAAKAGDGNYYDAADASGLGEAITEVASQTVDKPKGNVSVFAVKNGIAIDAWIKAYDLVAKRAPISVRTYQDTAYFYLPPSKYNFEVRPLQGSDVKMVTAEGIQSFDDKIIHKTISFDGGKIGITTTNNGKNWDCIVKIIDEESKVAASLRSYDAPKEVEVNPGTYKVTIQALGGMEGMETYSEVEYVQVQAGKFQPIAHNFSTGSAFIDSKADGNSIDSVVTIDEASSGKNVAGSRTYDRGTKFLLNPGTYKVKVAPLGKYKDRKPQSFTIEVKIGESTTKTVNF